MLHRKQKASRQLCASKAVQQASTPNHGIWFNVGSSQDEAMAGCTASTPKVYRLHSLTCRVDENSTCDTAAKDWAPTRRRVGRRCRSALWRDGTASVHRCNLKLSSGMKFSSPISLAAFEWSPLRKKSLKALPRINSKLGKLELSRRVCSNMLSYHTSWGLLGVRYYPHGQCTYEAMMFRLPSGSMPSLNFSMGC